MSPTPSPRRIIKINHASLNSQQDAFVIAGENGVQIFNMTPLSLMSNISAKITGNAKLACILHRTNLVCFVGGGKDTKYPNNTAMIWDDISKEIILEFTMPGGAITNVMMSPTRLICMQDKKIHIFAFPNQAKLIRAEEIRYNPRGLGVLSVDDLTGQQFAFPGFKVGTIRLMNLLNVSEMESISPSEIEAHLSEIAGIAMNVSGTLIATGSTKGTVVRIFDTRTKQLVTELRRGNVQATLHTLAFSPCSSFLTVTSDKGTIHIFSTKASDEATHSGQILRQVGISGDKDVAKFHLNSKVLACGFLGGDVFDKRHKVGKKDAKPVLENTSDKAVQLIMPICEDGSHHIFSFTADGHIQRESFELLIELAAEQLFGDE